jgi:hypothetical protein
MTGLFHPTFVSWICNTWMAFASCPARQGLPDDPYSLGMRALTAYHLAAGGYGQAQDAYGRLGGVARWASAG